MDKGNLIALFLIGAAATALLQMPETENTILMESSDNRTGQNKSNSADSSAENRVPVSEHPPRWWQTDSTLPFRVLEKNFCQIAQVTFGNTLSPEFRVCINNEGFRDENISVKNPEGNFRTAVLGDAVTFGLGVDNNETLPAHLERRLEYRTEMSHQTLNFGIPFMTTREEVMWFNLTGRRYEPDVVVLQYMENDAENLTRIDQLREKYYEPLPSNMSRARRSTIASRKAIRQERRERKNMSIEEEMETVEKYLNRLDRYSEKDDFKVFVMYYATEFSRRHVSYMREASEERDWGFMVSDLKNDSYTYSESFYLTPKGNNRTAAGLAVELEEKGLLEVEE